MPVPLGAKITLQHPCDKRESLGATVCLRLHLGIIHREQALPIPPRAAKPIGRGADGTVRR